MPTARHAHALAVALALTVAATALAGGPVNVAAVDPVQHTGQVERGADITVDFDQPIAPASITGAPFRFSVFGERSGVVPGTFTFENGDTRVRFDPDVNFMAGERIYVVLGNGIEGAGGAPFRASGFAWEFTVAAGAATMDFEQFDVLDTTEPGVSPRPYGGQACDLNEDGAPDLAIVNEDTSDIRVFLNKADGTGTFHAFMQPTNATHATPSPNRVADFNGDGHVDMATANTATSTVSVLLGNGDGSFGANVNYTVGSNPHGMAVLDADGDGDLDIAAACTSASHVAIILNDGTGAFGAATTFDGGGSGEYGMDSGDFDGDGITDLVVGHAFSDNFVIHLGNGDGTFTQAGSVGLGVAPWMIVAADMNGDGNLDVTSANGGSGTGSVSLGDGAGNLAAPTTVSYGGHMVATDVGDLDGDGDLDWVLSNFGSGQWHVRTNDGSAVFTHYTNYPAGANCSCAVILDCDGDGDLDLALTDEITDLIYLRKNMSTPPTGADVDGDGSVNFADVLLVLSNWGPCGPAPCVGDVDGNGDVGFADLLAVLSGWTG